MEIVGRWRWGGPEPRDRARSHLGHCTFHFISFVSGLFHSNWLSMRTKLSTWRAFLCLCLAFVVVVKSCITQGYKKPYPSVRETRCVCEIFDVFASMTNVEQSIQCFFGYRYYFCWGAGGASHSAGFNDEADYDVFSVKVNWISAIHQSMRPGAHKSQPLPIYSPENSVSAISERGVNKLYFAVGEKIDIEGFPLGI